MDCIFCKIVEGAIPSERVYEDDRVVAFRDLSPQAPVHVLIVPRKHIEHLQALQPDDEALLGYLLGRVPVVADQLGLAEDGFRLVNNCKEKAGQSVWHVHFHLLGGRTFHWPPG